MRKFAPNGKFGVPAVSGTIVQTFSTADATHAARTASAPAAATAAALTVADGAGTNDGTIAAITNAANAGSADVGPVIAAIQELADQVNKLIVDVADIRTKFGQDIADLADTASVLNSVTDALQSRGILG